MPGLPHANQTASNRKLIVYIAASLDGFIAGPNDDLTFLESVEVAGEDYGYNEFVSGVDTVIMGRKTYDWVMKQMPVFPHADKRSYIITRTERPAIGNCSFYTGDLKQLVLQLKQQPGKNIFIDGGAEVVQYFLEQRLIDEIVLSIIPVILGDGVRLFKNGGPELSLKLQSAKQFKSGLLQLHYLAG